MKYFIIQGHLACDWFMLTVLLVTCKCTPSKILVLPIFICMVAVLHYLHTIPLFYRTKCCVLKCCKVFWDVSYTWTFPPGVTAFPALLLHRHEERLWTRSCIISHKEVRRQDCKCRTYQQRGLGSGKCEINYIHFTINKMSGNQRPWFNIYFLCCSTITSLVWRSPTSNLPFSPSKSSLKWGGIYSLPCERIRRGRNRQMPTRLWWPGIILCCEY